jgi:hypothetical protein
MFQFNTLSHTIQLKHLETFIKGGFLLEVESLEEFVLLFFVEVLEGFVCFDSMVFYVLCFLPELVDFIL